MRHGYVFYPRTAAEVLALDILARHGWQPVTQDMVQPVRRIRARGSRRDQVVVPQVIDFDGIHAASRRKPDRRRMRRR